MELINQSQKKDQSCLDYWIEINRRLAEIELDNEAGIEKEQLLAMAIFLSGTTNEKLVMILWPAECDFAKRDDEIKTHDKPERQHADVKKLRGQKETKEAAKEVVSRIKPDFKKDKDQKSMAWYVCGEPFS